MTCDCLCHDKNIPRYVGEVCLSCNCGEEK